MNWQELDDFEKGFYPARYDVYEMYGATGVEARTLHYYVQRRLIPPAIGSGRAARYTYEHVVRLIVLGLLKKRGMTLREIGVLLDGLAVRDLHHISESQNPTEAIESVRRGLLHPTGARPEGSEPFRRVFITKGVELLVSPEYHARAAARSSDLLETIRDILDID